MSEKNSLIIATAGAGKTTFLINKALSIKSENVVITTYTNSNKEEIIKKIISKNKSIPSNITVQTWVSFLMQHGVKPYQGSVIERKIKGYHLVNTQSGVKVVSNGKSIYYSESELERHYFSPSFKLYSDKLSKFVVKCNEKTEGEVIKRLSRIYQHIFIDEVQDLAGNDLEILKLFFESKSKILLVGDVRQVTYLTHNERLHSGYSKGNLEKFIIDKKLNCNIDKTTLLQSHRNNLEICDFSSSLYPNQPASYPCKCKECRDYKVEHEGVFLIKEIDVASYIYNFNPTVLRYKESKESEWNYGESKGLTFDRVLIYPTTPIVTYLKKGILKKLKGKKEVDAFDIAKFYVAVTRARYSVAIVYDYKAKDIFIKGLNKFSSTPNLFN